MKKLLLLLIMLITLTNVSFASFPVVTEVSNDPDIFVWVIQPLLIVLIAFIAYQIYRFYRYLFKIVKNSFRFWPKFFAIFGLLVMSTIFVSAIILSIFAGGVGG
ncbi:MAG TPA: hypothetical protein EYQ51_02915 [Alphaproteobacteria bacterium]|nr:hypothetical protein [Alphaproteobacteria bacterium]